VSKWEMVRLGDVGVIITGNTPRKSDLKNYETNDIPFYKPGDFIEGRISSLRKAENNISTYAKKSARILPQGSVLVTCIGIIGKIGVIQEESACNQQINAIIPDEIICFNRYLSYAILHINKSLNDIANSAVVPIINKSQFSNIIIPLPPLDIQKKIATALDSANALIEKRKEQIEKLDLLIKSQFIEMFGDPVTNPKGWEKKQLSKLIVHANNGMARRGNDIDGDIVLRLVELQDGFLDYSKPNRILLSEFEKKRYLLFKNDFLFARVNGNPDYVGRCAVFHDIGEDVYYNDHIIRVRFDDSQLQGCFVSTLLNSQYGKRQMRSKIKTSAGQYTISQDGIGAIEIICPPLYLQTQFAEFVQKVEAQKTLLQKSLADMEQNYQSLLQKCFKGEIF